MASTTSDIYGLSLMELREKLLDIKNDETFSDVLVMAKKKGIRAHRCILTASSQFFTSVLHANEEIEDCGLDERETGWAGELQVLDCGDKVTDTEVFEKVIEFMYSGCIAITTDNVGAIFNMAVDFLIMDLLDAILKFVKNSVTAEYCLKYYRSLFQVQFEANDASKIQFISKMLDILQLVWTTIQENLPYIVTTQVDQVMALSSAEMRHMMTEGLMNKASILTTLNLFSVWLTSCPEDSFEVASLILKEAMNKPLKGVENKLASNEAYQKLKDMLNQNGIICEHKEIILGQCAVLLEGRILDESKQVANDEEIKEVESSTVTVPLDCTAENGTGIDSEDSDVDACKEFSDEITSNQMSEDELIKSPNETKIEGESVSKFAPIKEKNERMVTRQRGKTKLGLKREKKKKSSKKKIAKTMDNTSLEVVDGHVKKEVVQELQSNMDSQSTPHRNHDCLWCNESFNSQKMLKEHELDTHLSESSYKCKICEKDFRVRHRLARHLKTVHAKVKNHICKICDAGFVVEEYLKSHMSAKHSESPKHQCRECGKTFSYSNHLKRHMAIHTGEKPFKCKICDQAYSRNDRLTRHMFAHNTEEQFICQYCGKGYLRPEAHKRHLLMHEAASGEAKFSDDGSIKNNAASKKGATEECSICQRMIKFGYMKRHLRTHVEGRVLPSNQSHICPVCGIVLKKKCYMSAHMRCHTGVRPHTCSYCGKKFRTISHMITHKRMHTGERPYICDICPASFYSSSALKRHKATHSGIKSYTCMCGAAYYRSDHLKKHRQTCNSAQMSADSFTSLTNINLAVPEIDPQARLSIDFSK